MYYKATCNIHNNGNLFPKDKPISEKDYDSLPDWIKKSRVTLVETPEDKEQIEKVQTKKSGK